MDIKDMQQRARKNFAGKCRVCPNCNGVACAGQVPGMGGVRTAQSFQRNVDSWSKYGINMMGIGSHADIDTSITIWGQRLSMPIMVAPIGAVNINMTDVITEEEYCYAVCQGALDVGTIAFTGDSGVPEVFDAGLTQLGPTKGKMIPTIKPREDDTLIEYGQRALQKGAKILASDMDAATLIHMRMFGQPVERKTYEQWAKIMEILAVPFVIKGVMDAKVACELIKAGAKGIVISNHGGRMLDGMVSTAEILEETHKYCIEQGVRDKATIIVDGGIRSGEDVFKALALGADAVLIGRPAAISAVGGGREGVSCLLNNMKQALSDAMYMNGTKSIREIQPSMVRKFQN